MGEKGRVYIRSEKWINNRGKDGRQKDNKLGIIEPSIHTIGIMSAQSMNEPHLFGFAAIAIATNQR